MGTTPPRVLGDFFAARDFPDDQRTRIAQMVSAKDSVGGRLLRMYATRTDPYLEKFERLERIAGARVGSKLYRKRAIERIVEWLAEDDARGWSIYRQAAIFHIEKNLSALNTLLAEVPSPAADFTGRAALEAVCSRAREFEVSKEQILEFYEIWGVERLDSFDAIVDEGQKPNEAAEQRRELAALVKEVRALEKSVGDAIREISAVRPSMTSALRKLEEDEAAQRMLGDVQRDLSAALAALNERVEFGEGKLLALEDGSKNQIDLVTASALNAETQRIDIFTKDAIAAAVGAARGALVSAFSSDLASVKGGLEGQISELSSKLSGALHRRPGLPSRYRSPLAQISSCPAPRPNVSEEMPFVQAYARRLLTDHGLELGLELALAHHLGFLANRVIVADWAYVRAWLDCLEWHAYSLQLAAGPTWAGEEHWAEGAEHLFVPAALPKVLVIHNYDVGLVDCYLSPSLSLWYRQPKPAEPLAKLFLIPSGEEGAVTPLLAEHAFVLTANRAKERRPLALKDVARPAAAGEPAFGVAPAVVLSWLQAPKSPPAALEGELNRTEKALGCTFGSSLLFNVRNTSLRASKYFVDESAVALSMDCHLAPWIHAKYNGDRDSDLRTLLNPLSVAR